MKRLFNKLLLPISASLVILPISSCNKQSVEEKDTIEITSSINDITLIQNQEFKSKPLEAKCFDKNKQEKFMFIDFELKVKGFDKTPDWISINKKHEVVVSGINDVRDYEVTIVACNKTEGLYSLPRFFNIKVINERHIIPDSISIEIENDKYCMYGEKTIIPINIVPFKPLTEEKYLLKECDIEIEDYYRNDLFEIGGTSLEPQLIISKETDEKDIGSYKLKIIASLKADPNIFTYKYITIHIDNIYSQYDCASKCSFSRESADDEWTLSSVAAATQTINNVPTMIQNKPVTKIASNLCQKSQITRLVQIILPSTIVAIGPNAFANQLTLCSIEIPGVKYVGNSAFENDSIMEFRLRGEKPDFYYVGSKAFYGCRSLKLDFQNEIMWIGDFAFKNAGLRQFEIGENCVHLGTECFANCNQLSNFKIRTENPPVIGGANFNQTDQLSTIKVPIGSLDDYKHDESWSNLGKTIEGI